MGESPPGFEGVFYGSAPASLRVIELPDGVRFQIERPGLPAVMVDLSNDEVYAIIRQLGE